MAENTIITVRKITKIGAEALKGEFFTEGNMFNPMLDGNGTWIVSNKEAVLSKGTPFEWLYTADEIPFVAPPFNMDL